MKNSWTFASLVFLIPSDDLGIKISNKASMYIYGSHLAMSFSRQFVYVWIFMGRDETLFASVVPLYLLSSEQDETRKKKEWGICLKNGKLWAQCRFRENWRSVRGGHYGPHARKFVQAGSTHRLGGTLPMSSHLLCKCNVALIAGFLQCLATRWEKSLLNIQVIRRIFREKSRWKWNKTGGAGCAPWFFRDF